jgi:glyoxylase-like metal-dependent hydrolase (beta-lactamase superfamily II)/ferredoxin
MANTKLRRIENASGEFYVDSTCIDCDTCRWVAKGLFTQEGSMSAVTRQPETQAERLEAFRALLSCPTASIGCEGDKALLGQASQSLPLLIADNVYYCGYASESSFGAASYFIVREGGNVLIDSPRMNGSLGRHLEALGGVRFMFLTHRDDVADHQEWADRFGCTRIMHRGDIGLGLQSIETQIDGLEPYSLADDLLILPVPGHTRGHSVLIYKNLFAFTGDHLEFDEDLQKLRAFKDYCWYDWNEQKKSMQRLANYEFEWVLPGHGRRLHANKEKMKELMKECVQWMEED